VEIPVEVAGDEVRLDLGDRRYRVRSLAKNTSYEALRVNVAVTKGEKDLDAVRMMRRIRDAMSRRFRGMSVSEQRRVLREQLQKAGVSLPKARGRHRRTA
jgi:hypothetical protein